MPFKCLAILMSDLKAGSLPSSLARCTDKLTGCFTSRLHEENFFIHPEQASFRQYGSTEDHITHLTQEIEDCLSGSEGRLGGPVDGLSGSQDLLSGPEDRLSGPEDRLSGPEDRQGGPEDRLSGPEDRLSGLEDCLGGPEDRLSGPEDCLSGPEDRLGGPGGRHPGQETHLS